MISGYCKDTTCSCHRGEFPWDRPPLRSAFWTSKKENEKMKYEFVDLSLRLIDVTRMDYCDEQYIEKYQEIFMNGPNLFKPLSTYNEYHQNKILKWICNDPAVFEWCIENNIIREKKEEKEEVFYEVGNWFTDKFNNLCCLSAIGRYKYLLTTTTGIYYGGGAEAKHSGKITQKEFDAISGDVCAPFTKVEVEVKLKTWQTLKYKIS